LNLEGMNSQIRVAKSNDVPDILRFIKALAKYEKLEDEVTVTEKDLQETLFGPKRFAEVIFLEVDQQKLGFAIYFHSYSTFLGKPGLYLEDLYVIPEARGQGHGKALLVHLAQIAVERGCHRLEWSVLDWNKPAIDFYLTLGSLAMDGWTTHRLSGPALKKLASGKTEQRN